MTILETPQALADAFVRAAVSGNGSAIASIYEDGATLYPPVLAPAVRGRAAIEQVFKAFYASTRVVDELHEHVEEHVHGEVAVAHWMYRLKVRVRGSGEEPSGSIEKTMSGRAVWVLRRQRDGGFKIWVHHVSASPPPPAS
jgi:ketosteroid isomerase-like protein